MHLAMLYRQFNVLTFAFRNRYEHSITCLVVDNSLKLYWCNTARDAVGQRCPEDGSCQRAEKPPSRKLHDLDGCAMRPGNCLFCNVKDRSSHRGR